MKIRLGRLNNRGQQKGVDGLIYRDLTALARAGVIARAYLFTGDEDIRESVVAAQDLGVQVVLMSFTPTRRTGRSAALVREADEVVVLDREFWTPHFSAPKVAPSTTGPPSQEALEASASSFAKDWAAGATAEEAQELLSKEPWMPRDLYVQLLLFTETSTGSLKAHGETKSALRKAFWNCLKSELSATEPTEATTQDASEGEAG